jgi:hypothetical protein
VNKDFKKIFKNFVFKKKVVKKFARNMMQPKRSTSDKPITVKPRRPNEPYCFVTKCPNPPKYLKKCLSETKKDFEWQAPNKPITVVSQ